MAGNEAVLVVACGSGTASTAGVSGYPKTCRQGLLITSPWECFQPLVTRCSCHRGRTLQGSLPVELPVGQVTRRWVGLLRSITDPMAP